MMTGRAWQRMLSGRRLDLLDPSPLDVEIEDIAHGLSRVARWNGQTVGPWPFSVAQHCLLVEDLAGRLKDGLETPWRLAALLHDAPEYVIGDMISPFKAALGIDYAASSTGWRRRSICASRLPASCRRGQAADQTRRPGCGAPGGDPACRLHRRRSQPVLRPAAPDLAHALEPLAPDQAKQAFVARFQELAGGS